MSKQPKELKEAIGYLRTSSAANVGPDKDSETRQRDTIERYATRSGVTIVAWFYDAAVSGADAIDSRPGFAAALERIASNGVRTIIVETANRFARDLIVQETGFRLLCDQGIELIAADSPTSFVDDTPTAALIRQVLGAVAQFEKAALVAKLKGARDRKRRETGKVEGRKRRVDRLDADGAEHLAAAVREAKRLRRASPKTGDRLSYRDIAEKLEAAGFLNEAARRYNPASVKRMIEGGLETHPTASE